MAMSTRKTRREPPLGPKPKVLVGQLRILLEAIEEDSTMFNARNNDMISILNVEKWDDLTSKLNEFPNGAIIPVASWKYVLRYWSASTKKKRNQKGAVTRSRSAALTSEEATELAQLEKRFYEFLQRQESEVVDVTEHGTQDPVPKTDGENYPESVQIIVEMSSVFPNENEENAKPARKKRTHVREVDGGPGKPKKLKIVLDRVNVGGHSMSARLVIGDDENMRKLHVVSHELEEHISTIQNRIHMIKDLWKHRCGDN